MRTNNTFGVQFITRANKSKTNKDDKLLLPLYVRISVDYHRVEVSLKRFISPENWNQTKGIARGKNVEIRALNTYLEQIRSRLTECYQELLLKKKLVTAEAIKNLFCGVEEKEFAHESFRLPQRRNEKRPGMGNHEELLYHKNLFPALPQRSIAYLGYISFSAQL
jgi:hypothetical protein